MKKLLSILLVFILVLFMFACGKQSDESYSTEKQTTIYDTATETTAASENTLCSVPTKPAESPTKSFQEIRTNYIFNSVSEYPDFPYTVIIESSDELKKYIADNEEKFDLSRKDKVYADTTIGFLDAVDKYGDEFFEKNSLVIAITTQPSGSIRYWGAKLETSSGGKLCDTLVLTEYHPQWGTDDCASWHIIVEAKKGTYTDEIKLQIDKVRAEMPDY